MYALTVRQIAVLKLAQNVSLHQDEVSKFLNMTEEEVDAVMADLNWGIAAFRKIGARFYEGYLLDRLAQASAMVGRIDIAVPSLEEALEIHTEIGDRRGQGAALLIAGASYYRLREYQKALESLSSAADHFRAVKERSGEAFALINMGNCYLETDQPKKALKHFRAALPLALATRDDGMRADALNGIAWVLNGGTEHLKAIEAYRQVIAIYNKRGVKIEKADALMGIGQAYQSLGMADAAADNYRKALALFTEAGHREGSANILTKLMYLYEGKRSPALAIIFGKRAINLHQELRVNIQAVDERIQENYVRSVESAYRKLADILIGEGRLPEAQAVLAMLKDEEISEYLRRDATEIEKLRNRVDLRDSERAALAKYDRLASKIASIGAEFSKLREARGRHTAAEQKRYDELAAQLEQASVVFQVFLRQLADELGNRTNVVAEIEENTGLQSDLRSWGEGVVSLYTVIADDRYRVILTTPEIQVDGKTEISAADLNRKIDKFRQAVQDPRTDPRPLGKELFDIIVEPVRSQLEDTRATTLLWSLDGALRYLPLAALWDGRQYFGEKYQNVIITLASRTRLSERPEAEWRILGLGVTGARQVTEPNGTRLIRFSALPFVRSELTGIVRDATAGAGETGVVNGRRLVDENFTQLALEEQLAERFRAVHIASHFSFRPGDISRSFLLLGDGTALTMDKVKTSPQLRFTGVELLTLSACDTAVGEKGATGKEVESFAVLAQQNGAKAVMATLWPVVDESTALLMKEFYRTKSALSATSKAESLQIAQRGMIEGRIKSSGAGGGCRAEPFADDGGKKDQFKCDPNAPFSHPYFWSPFVLIGNWR